MTSRIPSQALRRGSVYIDAIVAFLAYMSEWEHHADGEGGFLSHSTAEGLRVTLNSTLSLVDYLTSEIGFRYVMTSRLCQDPVEGVFGIVRQCSGSNDHPTPQQFVITISCISFCNLVRSPESGNVDAATLGSLLDSTAAALHQSSDRQAFVDELITNIHFDEANNVLQHLAAESDHASYTVARSDQRLIYYITRLRCEEVHTSNGLCAVRREAAGLTRGSR